MELKTLPINPSFIHTCKISVNGIYTYRHEALGVLLQIQFLFEEFPRYVSNQFQ